MTNYLLLTYSNLAIFTNISVLNLINFSSIFSFIKLNQLVESLNATCDLNKNSKFYKFNFCIFFNKIILIELDAPFNYDHLFIIKYTFLNKKLCVYFLYLIYEII